MSLTVFENPLSMDNSLSTRVALVTGGGRGIGKGISIALAKAGVAYLAINYLSDEGAAEGTRKLAIEAATNPHFHCDIYRCDVSVNKEVVSMVSSIKAKAGAPISVLVNNAGRGYGKPLHLTDETDYDALMNSNAKSAFLVTQAVVSGMMELNWGRIITVLSLASYTGGSSLFIPYAMSKSALIGLVNTYASLLCSTGITSNGISPGMVETESITKHLNNDMYVNRLKQICVMPRFGHIDEVGNLAAMLATTGYINGQIIEIDGGIYKK